MLTQHQAFTFSGILLVVGAVLVVAALGFDGHAPADVALASEATTEGAAVADPEDASWMRPLLVAGGILMTSGVGLLVLALSGFGRAQR